MISKSVEYTYLWGGVAVAEEGVVVGEVGDCESYPRALLLDYPVRTLVVT
jgi:hypothetical protein